MRLKQYINTTIQISSVVSNDHVIVSNYELLVSS